MEAAEKQATIASQTLGAQIRPVLVNTSLEVANPHNLEWSPDQLGPIYEPVMYPPDADAFPGLRGAALVDLFAPGESSVDGALISVPFRNAGAGLAMIQSARLEVGGASLFAPVLVTPNNVAVGERGRASFRAPPSYPVFEALRKAVEDESEACVVLEYTDFACGQITATRFWLKLIKGFRGEVTDVRVTLLRATA